MVTSSPELDQVRFVRDDDSAALINLIGSCWAEYPGVLLDIDGEEPWLRAPASYYARVGGVMWVLPGAGTGAEGELAACIGLRPLDPPEMELKSLYVAAGARRGGWGSTLVALVEREAVVRGARRLQLWSDTRFLDAHRLYERLGYVGNGSRELHDLSDTTEYGYAKDV